MLDFLYQTQLILLSAGQVAQLSMFEFICWKKLPRRDVGESHESQLYHLYRLEKQNNELEEAEYSVGSALMFSHQLSLIQFVSVVIRTYCMPILF